MTKSSNSSLLKRDHTRPRRAVTGKQLNMAL